MVTAKNEIPTIPWWLVLIQAIATLILGIFLVTSPGVTTLIIVQFVGIYWLVTGIFQIVAMFIDTSMWGWKLFAGLLGILAGFSVLQHPLYSTLLLPSVLVIVLGIQGIIIGIIGLIQAFKGAGWGKGILGAVNILFGIILLSSPVLGAVTLVWVLGIFGIVGGILGIIGAFKLKS